MLIKWVKILGVGIKYILKIMDLKDSLHLPNYNPDKELIDTGMKTDNFLLQRELLLETGHCIPEQIQIHTIPLKLLNLFLYNQVQRCLFMDNREVVFNIIHL